MLLRIRWTETPASIKRLAALSAIRSSKVYLWCPPCVLIDGRTRLVWAQYCNWRREMASSCSTSRVLKIAGSKESLSGCTGDSGSEGCFARFCHASYRALVERPAELKASAAFLCQGDQCAPCPHSAPLQGRPGRLTHPASKREARARDLPSGTRDKAVEA